MHPDGADSPPGSPICNLISEIPCLPFLRPPGDIVGDAVLASRRRCPRAVELALAEVGLRACAEHVLVADVVEPSMPVVLAAVLAGRMPDELPPEVALRPAHRLADPMHDLIASRAATPKSGLIDRWQSGQ